MTGNSATSFTSTATALGAIAVLPYTGGSVLLHALTLLIICSSVLVVISSVALYFAKKVYPFLSERLRPASASS